MADCPRWDCAGLELAPRRWTRIWQRWPTISVCGPSSDTFSFVLIKRKPSAVPNNKGWSHGSIWSGVWRNLGWLVLSRLFTARKRIAFVSVRKAPSPWFTPKVCGIIRVHRPDWNASFRNIWGKEESSRNLHSSPTRSMPLAKSNCPVSTAPAHRHRQTERSHIVPSPGLDAPEELWTNEGAIKGNITAAWRTGLIHVSKCDSYACRESLQRQEKFGATKCWTRCQRAGKKFLSVVCLWMSQIWVEDEIVFGVFIVGEFAVTCGEPVQNTCPVQYRCGGCHR